jgi:toxin YoeB
LKILFHERAFEDYLHWQANDPKLLQKLNVLLKECARTPYTGTGKPEPLRGPLTGWWSRRLNKEHRLVYCMRDGQLMVASCRYHYE